MRLTKQELLERNNKILHTAYNLFCEFGVDDITLAQIAKASNVGTSTIYRHFKTKANLLWHTQKILWEKIVEQINADGEGKLASAKNGFEEISIRLYFFKAFYTRHSTYLLFANDYRMYLVRNHINLPQQAYDQLLHPVRRVFESALKRGHDDGSISSRDSVADQFFAIWGIMRGFTDQIVTYDKMYEGDNPWERRFELVFHYALKALKDD